MLDTFLKLFLRGGLVLFCLPTLLFGLFLLLGSLNSLRRFWWRENQRHQTLFAFVSLLTIMATGGFLTFASSMLLWQELGGWLH